jgi:hypothetical protein
MVARKNVSSLSTQLLLVQNWKHPIGTSVTITRNGKELQTKTASDPWMLGSSSSHVGHTAVIMLDDVSGCWALSDVRVAQS